MKFCFLFLFKQINYSLLQRRSSAEKQFNLKTIPFCCLYDKNNCTSSTFVLRGKSNYFCLLSLFLFFGGMQLIKDTISTTARLPITPWWEFNTRRGWKWNSKAAERELVCGGRGLGWSRARQRPSNWRGLPPFFWWDSNDFPSAFSVSLHVCLFVWSTEVAQLAKSLSSIQHASSRWGVLEKNCIRNTITGTWVGAENRPKKVFYLLKN